MEQTHSGTAHETTSREYQRGRMAGALDRTSPSELGRRPEWTAFPVSWERSSEDYRQGYRAGYRGCEAG